MKARLLHIALVLVGLALVSIPVAQAQFGNMPLGTGLTVGFVLAGLYAAVVRVSNIWADGISAMSRVFAVIGTAAGVAGPVVAYFSTSLSPNSKWSILAGFAVALLAAWKTAFGATGAIPAKAIDLTPVTKPNNPRITGKGSVDLVAGGLICLMAAAFLLAMCWSGRAQAQTPTPGPQFGGCFASGTICLGPSAAITVGQFNLSTSKFTGGFIPGAGYGATFMADTWHTVGADLYLSFVVSQGAPNNAIPTLMLSFANYLRVGLGYSITEQSAGAALKQPLLMFGVGSNFGGSTSYVQKQAAKAQAEGQVAP